MEITLLELLVLQIGTGISVGAVTLLVYATIMKSLEAKIKRMSQEAFNKVFG